ncbi:MAG: STAS domain-containing protein [Zoogloeaceae bacterium]|jgi:phospholipid transport system transporter-binding protein|nr:STAS domain-containing protein [Zoogloeaceae bacterium]
MIARRADRLHVSAPMRMSSARTLLEAGLAQLEGARTVDLADVAAADSSGLAVLIAWQRQARMRGACLAFVNVPDSLKALAALYGLDVALGFVP